MTQQEIRILSSDFLGTYTQAAQRSPRLRKQRNLHEVDEPIIRVVRAMQPRTYMQPHRHLGEAPFRLFVLLQGSIGVLYFAENGQSEEAIVLSAERGNYGIEVPGDQFFTLVCLAPDSVLLEIREGPLKKDTRETLAGFPDELDYLTRESGSDAHGRIELLLDQWKEDFLQANPPSPA
jgi:cupin fold WbuC family metalloprotein